MKLSEKDYFAQNYKIVTVNNKKFEEAFILKLSTKEDFTPLKDASKENINIIEFESNFAGSAPDEFDESFLANLRENLKNAENNDVVFCIKPVINATSLSAEEAENLNKLFYHIARRIKDCSCVVGFVLPKFDSNSNIEQTTSLINMLKKKHPEYVYILNSKNEISSITNEYPNRLAFY